MNKIILLALIFMLALNIVSTASAVDNKLEITDLTIYVDGSKDSGADETGGSVDNVLPESEVKVKLTIKNTFDDSDPNEEDIDIDKIELNVKLNDINDGDDVEYSPSKFKLKPDSDNDFTFIFQVPLIVEEDIYKLEIDVEGEDDNDTKHKDSVEVEIEVEKETYDLRFRELNFTESTLECGRDTTLKIDLVNVGDEEEEEEVTLTIVNSRLNIDLEDTFDLDGSTHASNNNFEKEYPFSFDESVIQGTYLFDIKAAVGSTKFTKTISLVFQQCGDGVADTDSDDSSDDSDAADSDETESDSDDNVVTSQPNQDSVQTTSANAPVTAYRQSFFDSDMGSLALILLEVIVILVGIGVIVVFMRKR